MNALALGLAIALAGISVQRILLSGFKRRMQIKKHAYRFHSIRDHLQLHAIGGRIEQTAITYQFLMWICNFSIKNAGTMSFRDLVHLASDIEEEVDGRKEFLEDINKQPDEIRILAAECMMTFGYMLIVTDPLVNTVVSVRRVFVQSHKLGRSVVEFSASQRPPFRRTMFSCRGS